MKCRGAAAAGPGNSNAQLAGSSGGRFTAGATDRSTPVQSQQPAAQHRSSPHHSTAPHALPAHLQPVNLWLLSRGVSLQGGCAEWLERQPPALAVLAIDGIRKRLGFRDCGGCGRRADRGALTGSTQAQHATAQHAAQAAHAAGVASTTARLAHQPAAHSVQPACLSYSAALPQQALQLFRSAKQTQANEQRAQLTAHAAAQLRRQVVHVRVVVALEACIGWPGLHGREPAFQVGPPALLGGNGSWRGQGVSRLGASRGSIRAMMHEAGNNRWGPPAIAEAHQRHSCSGHAPAPA